MEVDCARDFMEVLIQRGQGRNSVFSAILCSYQKRSAERIFLSLRLWQTTRDDSTGTKGSGCQRAFFSPLPRGDNTQFE